MPEVPGPGSLKRGHCRLSMFGEMTLLEAPLPNAARPLAPHRGRVLRSDALLARTPRRLGDLARRLGLESKAALITRAPAGAAQPASEAPGRRADAAPGAAPMPSEGVLEKRNHRY
ncbi:hypothetical protein AAFF_G00352730 [Aldrovandia affinis]|uniref:Uncharacterized protein n=1 Tax=Aldrovandia affinis TaxID=143900 RepID=A0AAD7SIY4_9TELE|nr:hypothetical protein AAFF_G00352730 [Aldrovandia affinis]